MEPGRRDSLASAAAWASGAAIGAALGSWLTAVGQAGAGASEIEPLYDLLLLPAVAFALTFAAALVLLRASAVLRSRGEAATPGRPEGSQLPRASGDA